MKTNKTILSIGLLAVVALAFFPSVAAAQQTRTLRGHVPAAVSRLHLHSIGDLPTNTALNLTISLPVQNEDALNALLQQVYDPSSTNYHHYLNPEQFNRQFGPSASDYQKAVNFAKTAGLTVACSYSNHMILDVNGKASDIEKAFKVKFRKYHHPTENRDFYAPDSEPSVSAGLPISHISGMDNYLIPQPLLKQRLLIKSANSKPGFGSGPGGTYMGNDFRTAYVPGVALDGTGQSVALFELDGYFTADIISYEAQAGLPNLTITNVAVDGGVSFPSFGGSGEVSLDIEMVISMATNLSQVIVYEAPNGFQNSPVDLLNRIATDNSAKQISSSWGIGDDPAFDVFYKQMALQGQSFFQASGDDGAYFSNSEFIDQYADDTNITLVGGTTLSTAGPGGAWSSETVWNWLVEGIGDAGSGGGTNFNGIPIPSWQQGVNMSTNMGSTTLRNVPDVALTADNIFVIFFNGVEGGFGGTSCAAPLWAAYTALVNQQATNQNLPPVGFLNPAIYTIGQSAIYTNCFHDITTGNNTNLIIGDKYFAVPGYDLCTGWGTPNGSNLINALLSTPVTNIFTHLSPPSPPYGTKMAALNGNNPNGNWYLFVQDDQVFNGGIISNGWSVALTTANPIGVDADDYLSMIASPTNLTVGENANVSIGITNYGPYISSNVVVSDSIPLGFALISSNATSGTLSLSGQTLNWTLGNLAVGGSAQLNMALQATVQGQAINSASTTSATPDLNPADGSAQVSLNVLQSSPPAISGATGSGGKFKLSVSSPPFPIIVQASTNLVSWVNISTNTPPFIYTDTVSQYPCRFYRAVIAP